MQVTPSRAQRRSMNPFLQAAAAVGGTAARYAINRAVNYMTTPTQNPYMFQNMSRALPRASNAPARGRGGRNRGRGRGQRPQAGSRPGGQPSQGVQTRSGSCIVVQDTEILATVKKGVTTKVFNPAPEELPRLAGHAMMYRRYRIMYMNISYKSGSGTSTAGNVAVGVSVGPAIDATKVTDSTAVLKLRPSFYVPAWKNASLTLGKDIDTARFMIVGDKGIDGVSFTLYTAAAADDLGMIQVSYKVEFSHPVPF